MNWLLIGGAFLIVFFFTSETSKMVSVYDPLFKKYTPPGIPWTFMQTICFIESNFGENPRVKIGLNDPTNVYGSRSSDGLSWGIMQLRPSTARDFDPNATEILLNNAEYSILIASRYIDWCRKYILKNTDLKESDPRFLEYLAKSYNQGVGNTVNEIKYKSLGFAANYWEKFQKAQT
jgi:hypothetical protein